MASRHCQLSYDSVHITTTTSLTPTHAFAELLQQLVLAQDVLLDLFAHRACVFGLARAASLRLASGTLASVAQSWVECAL